MTAFAQTVLARTRARLASERGFTLIEMLNTLVILAILMSISFSTYTSLHLRAEQKQAAANVRNLLPFVAAYRADNGTYFGMTMPLLNSLYMNGQLDLTYYDIGGTLDTTNYCIQYTVPTNDYTAKATGPDGVITVGPGNVC